MSDQPSTPPTASAMPPPVDPRHDYYVTVWTDGGFKAVRQSEAHHYAHYHLTNLQRQVDGLAEAITTMQQTTDGMIALLRAMAEQIDARA